MSKVLVTGGAGFIGGHIADRLVKEGHEVRIFDNLELPTHMDGLPEHLPKEAEFIKGDMRNKKELLDALKGVNVIFHQAAAGGFTPEISKYFDSNSLGTANLMELIIKNKIPIEKIIVASSVAVYGEGKYRCKEHGIVFPEIRKIGQLSQGMWEIRCPICKNQLTPSSIDEGKPVNPAIPYSISKYDQERICLTLGEKFGIPTVALRYFVTYGPRQSLFNPYTGVCSIFSMQILNNKRPVVYEDGLQTRDFIYVEDIARANLLVMNRDEANYQVFNVGSGKGTSILSLAKLLIKEYGKEMEPKLDGEFRIGDVRHIVADTSKIKKLGFEPKTDLKSGIRNYIDWIQTQGDVKDYFDEAKNILERQNIVLRTGND